MIDTIQNYALGIECKSKRTRFLSELGKKHKGMRLMNTMKVSEMEAIKDSIN